MKSTTTIETIYCPAGLNDDGTWHIYHDHRSSDIDGAKQQIKEIKADIKKYPRIHNNHAEFKIVKRTQIISTTEWEEIE